MEPYHRKALDKSTVELVNDLDPIDVMPELIAENIMKTEDYERLGSKCNRRSQVTEFLSVLKRRGSKAFPTFLFALEKQHVYTELAKSLKSQEEMLKTQVETETRDFVTGANLKDTYEFLEMKITLGHYIGKRDALRICKYFGLPDEVATQVHVSPNPGEIVIGWLEKLKHITTSNVSLVFHSFKHLTLGDAANVLQDYQERSLLPELSLSIKMSFKETASGSLVGEDKDLLEELLSNRIRSFHRKRKISNFLKKEFHVCLVDLREESIVVKVPRLENLVTLETKVTSGELEQKLTLILLEKEESDDVGKFKEIHHVKLRVWCDHRLLTEARQKLSPKVLPSLLKTSHEEEDFPDYDEAGGDDPSVDEESFSFEQFLERVGLEGKYHDKLTLKTFTEVKESPCIKESDIVQLFWQKLSSLDYRARSNIFLRLNESSPFRKISIRDFIFSIMQCSDVFLRQDIVEKMSACHLAVPVLLQGVDGGKSEFLLWSLRRIIKKWKDLNSVALEQHIVKTPVFTVSFLRIGDIRGFSKSSIMNNLLGPYQGNDPHPYFLTKHDDPCPPKFSLGCLESVWYLPMNTNGSETFRWISCFLNLRGDCSKFPSHTKFACKSANITVIFIAIRNRTVHLTTIRAIKSASKKLFFIAINDERDRVPQKKPKFVQPNAEWLYYHSLELDSILDKLSLEIVQCHTKSNRVDYKAMEDLTELCGDTIECEEEITECMYAKQMIKQIIDIQSAEDLLDFKFRVFPLQAIWTDWVNIDKERLKPDTGKEESVEFSRDDIARRKADKRKQQLNHALSPTMEVFRKTLHDAEKNISHLGYFLFYLQERLFCLADVEIRRHLQNIAFYDEEIKKLDVLIQPPLRRESGHCEVDTDSNREAERRYKRQRQEWKVLGKEESENCKKKTIGLEHFLRELGQWHEAHTELNTEKDNITMSLPGIAAKLLAHGHSLEIMDGDTGRVPLSWITSVLDKLTQDLVDPRILVLCVVGVQSSGKSTLLNTMFGVKFPVRAGRCTRGLFIQMLPVDMNYAKKLGFQYIVLVDSEGIRSQEKNLNEDCRFDNELVTLALCMSDIAILNIEGENIGPEMTGLLEIAAHALIKMKKVDLHSQCRIVQQRVSDLTASERNKINMNQIVETLNEAVRVAAREEGYGDRYQQFSDVFGLRLDDNLQFIPCLWTGPMSPPSQFYSDVVTKIKEDILSDIEMQKLVPQFTVSSFTQRIRDVWGTVKDEKFLFNFQDSIKALDFNSLCMELSKRITNIRLQLVHKRMDWQGNIQSSEEDPDIVFKKIKEECRNELQLQKDSMFSSLETFISQHRREGNLRQYWNWLKQSVQINFIEIENDLLCVLESDTATKRLRDDIARCVTDARMKLLTDAKMERSSQSDSSWKQLKKDSDPEQIFSLRWNQFLEHGMQEFSLKPMSEKAMEVSCENLLISITTDMAVSTEIQKLYKEEGGVKKHSHIDDWEKYYPDKAGEQNVKEWFLQNQHTLQDIIDFSISKLRGESSIKAFDANLFQSILRHVLQTFVPPRITSDPPYLLKAKLLLHIGAKLFDVALQNQRLFEAENSFEKLFNKEKKNLREDFFSFLRNENQVERAIKCTERYFHEWGKDLVIKKLRHTCSLLMTQNGLSDNTSINKQILKELCEGRSPEEYIRYTNNHTDYINGWIQNQIVKLWTKCEDGKPWWDPVERVMKECSRVFSQQVEIAFSSTNDEIAFKMWIELFVKGIRDRGFTRHKDLAMELKTYLVLDLHTFKIQLMNFLQSNWADNIFKEMKMSKTPKEKDIRDFVTSFAVTSISEVLKYVCFEQCPLCKAPCSNSLPTGQHHEHVCFTHIPRGISGIKDALNSQLIIDACSTCVESSTATYFLPGDGTENPRLCKYYEKDFPNWSMKLQGEMMPNYTSYWRWVMSNYNEQLANHYRCSAAKIPSSWKKITKKNALQSLKMSPSNSPVSPRAFFNKPSFRFK